MKKTQTFKLDNTILDDMLWEYNFDYRKVRPNCFAVPIGKKRAIVTLDEDVAEIFTTSDL